MVKCTWIHDQFQIVGFVFVRNKFPKRFMTNLIVCDCKLQIKLLKKKQAGWVLDGTIFSGEFSWPKSIYANLMWKEWWFVIQFFFIGNKIPFRCINELTLYRFETLKKIKYKLSIFVQVYHFTLIRNEGLNLNTLLCTTVVYFTSWIVLYNQILTSWRVYL